MRHFLVEGIIVYLLVVAIIPYHEIIGFFIMAFSLLEHLATHASVLVAAS